MTPQSSFMVVAPIDPNQEASLRKLLTTMNHRPGVVNPENNIVPFGQLDRLHFARLVILDDPTLDDITRYGVSLHDIRPSLAFLGDCDGPADDFLVDLIQRADGGLRRIFSHCEGFAPGCDLLSWMQDHEQPPAAMYVNWVGRTVQQIREESAVRNELASYIDGNAAALAGKEPRQVFDELRRFVSAEQQVGRLTVTAPRSTPLGWRLRNLLHAVVPLVLLLPLLVLLLFSPLLIVTLMILSLLIFASQLRRRERRDLEIVPRPAPAHVSKLADLEDHSCTNQFSALGSVKPGVFRRWTVTLLLWILDYTTRHVFNRGYLTRVKTIHFARWVFLDNKQRLFFASNYDGSLESYMDDFINKVAWGLNLVFSNGVGYPRTSWLILNGARHEQKFKYFLRRHELPTEVWYNAHAGLTVLDLERNTRIRQGMEQRGMTDGEIREWLKLI